MVAPSFLVSAAAILAKIIFLIDDLPDPMEKPRTNGRCQISQEDRGWVFERREEGLTRLSH
jgi:hypothetical protein